MVYANPLPFGTLPSFSTKPFLLRYISTLIIILAIVLAAIPTLALTAFVSLAAVTATIPQTRAPVIHATERHQEQGLVGMGREEEPDLDDEDNYSYPPAPRDTNHGYHVPPGTSDSSTRMRRKPTSMSIWFRRYIRSSATFGFR